MFRWWVAADREEARAGAVAPSIPVQAAAGLSASLELLKSHPERVTTSPSVQQDAEAKGITTGAVLRAAMVAGVHLESSHFLERAVAVPVQKINLPVAKAQAMAATAV
jgi:hypothetical protein